MSDANSNQIEHLHANQDAVASNAPTKIDHSRGRGGPSAWPSARGPFARANRSGNAAPGPGVLGAALIDPPKRSMVAWQMASPSPEPCPAAAVVKNGSNRGVAGSAGGPRPSARTSPPGAPPSSRP